MYLIMAKPSPSNPLGYIVNREYYPQRNFTKTLIRERLRNSRNLFRKDLLAHYGCINAIEFSNRGDLLVSGGDDRRVLLWNVEQAVQGVARTVAMRFQHNSNIFCLGFDSTNGKIFSAGNDDQVIVHDTSTGEAVNFFLHEQPVYGLSIDPLNDHVFASACDDGRVLLYDIREPASSEPFCLASYNSSFNAVMFNPLEPRILTTANSKEGVGLWDVRKPRQILLKYGKNNTSQSCMSVRFNNYGTHILALRRRLPPVLYSVHSPEHICQFDHPGYYNSCTMKTCCFAGEDDEYVLSGSDDFGLYVWKIPPSDERDQWVHNAHMILRGHRSIVNQVRYNPANCIIASSGVEKLIKFWSPFTLPESSGSLEKEPAENPRKIFTHEEYINLVLRSGEFMTHDYSNKSTKEDPRMMAFFDSLVQREIEGWSTDESASTEVFVQENPASPSGSDSHLSDTPVTVLTAALVEALVDGQDNNTLPHSSLVDPLEEGSESETADSQNRISQLIARKRAQLMRLARSREGENVRKTHQSRSQTLLFMESSSDSSDSGRDVSVDADDTSNTENGTTADVADHEPELHGRASTSRSRNFHCKNDIDTRKRKQFFYQYSDSSDDEDWHLQQKRKRRAENRPSVSSESDSSLMDDKKKTKCNKIFSKSRNDQSIPKEVKNDTDTSNSDTDDEDRRVQTYSRLRRIMISKSGKLNNFNNSKRSAFTPQTYSKKVCKMIKDLSSDESSNEATDCCDSVKNRSVGPTKSTDKTALDKSTAQCLTETPNHSSSSGTSFQEAETPDSGIALTSSPFSRPSSNSSLRSSSPHIKSSGEMSCSVVCERNAGQEESGVGVSSNSSIHVELPGSDVSSNRNASDSISDGNSNGSDWIFEKFRNRVNRTRRNYRKHLKDDSDSN